jgi:hypothetical protein
VRVLEYMPDGARWRTYNDAADLVGKLFENRVTLILIPVECLDDDFFRLSTRIAGELVPRLLTSNSRVRIILRRKLAAFLWP